MGDTIGLRVMVRDDTITITLPGPVSDLSEAQWLYRVATNVVDDRRVAVRKADFLARASRIANNKARELGWIVEGKATPSIFLG